MGTRKRSGVTRARVRRLAAVSCATAVVTAGSVLSGTAYAADNLPPKQPLVQDLKTENEACGTGDDKAYVSGPPTLWAVLYDPEEDDQPAEGNSVKAQFEAWWTDAAGVEQRRTYTSYDRPSGTAHPWQMPEDVPANTVVSWHVRADDGEAVSAWSSEGGGPACEFVYDDSSPQPAVVTSPDYSDEQWYDGVGVYGGFTMDSPSPDVVGYRYRFTGGTYGTARPDVMGGPATVRFLPVQAGPDSVSVQAIDRSGRSSGMTTYFFRVKDGRAPVAHWKLDDPAGSRSAAAERGTAARAGTGVTFGGAAPSGTGATATAALDGSGHGFLTPDAPAVTPGKTFAVSAWARPAQTDRNMTVASQDAGDTAGFRLGLSTRDSGPAWSFAIGGTRLTGGAPETGEWAHLLGLYDQETGTARLYVNGRPVGDAVKATPSATSGAFQIGRARGTSGYHARWHGSVGDVQVHDRVVVPSEVTDMAYRMPKFLGRWSLENAVDGASPERTGGAPLRLGAGARIYRLPDSSCSPDLDPDCPYVPPALVGDGHLELDGETGHAVAEGPVVDTEDSFTLGVVVRLADSAPARPMTVLSQAGENTDIFKVRYEPSQNAWQLIVAQKDEVGAAETVVSRMWAADGGKGGGHRLAVVYDDAADTVKLFVNGSTNEQATGHLPSGWHSSGALQIGRAKAGDGWGEYLHGDVDEVQAYTGALKDNWIAFLGQGVDFLLD